VPAGGGALHDERAFPSPLTTVYGKLDLDGSGQSQYPHRPPPGISHERLAISASLPKYEETHHERI
jgi:hypothetical protein